MPTLTLFSSLTDFSFYYQFMDAFLLAELPAAAPVTEYSGYLPDKEFAILHTSTPNIKLYYPEPFIATPTFINEDIWFLHITIYQYWLWFIFISLIVFFFLGFLITLRWCNIRHRPVRETRGVSRSKCGDLITAVVPVSWAASIIIHESTDAIEFNDGFGSTDVAIGIRAYQWGWEYYYPKSLNLNQQTNETSHLGNSLPNTWSEGPGNEFFDFKSSAIYSDITAHSSTNYSTQLLSLNSPETTDLVTESVVGDNKLIARRATTLLNSADILNLDATLNYKDPSLTGFDLFKTNFVNYVFEKTYPTKPSYANHQISYFSTRAALHNAFTFLNWSDVRQNMGANFASLGRLLGNASVYSGNSPLVIEDNLLNLPTSSVGLIKNARAVLAFWLMTNSSVWTFAPVADQDFKRWSAFDLLEDSFWASSDWSNELTLLVGDFTDTNHLVTDSNVFVLNSRSLTYALLNSEEWPAVSSLLLSNKLAPSYLTSSDVHSFIVATWLNSTLFMNNFVKWKSLAEVLGSTSVNTIFDYNLSLFKISILDLIASYSLESGLSLTKTTGSAGVGDFIDTSSDFLSMWRNLVTFSNAYWKVFKPTLDEQRGFFFASNFSNTALALPVVATSVPTTLSGIQKNSQSSFADVLTLRSVEVTRPLGILNTLKLNREAFTAFPFNLSFESDSIRYTWFDWYSTRNSIVTKALDTSVFNLHAAKDYNYNFVSNTVAVSDVNKLDNYYLKFSQARKFFLPITTYLPFFYANNMFIVGTDTSVNFLNYKQQLSNTDLSVTSTPLLTQWTSTNTATRPYIASLTSTSNSVDTQTGFMDILFRLNYMKKSLHSGIRTCLLNVDYVSITPLNAQNSIVNTLRTVSEFDKYQPTYNVENLTTPAKTSQYQPLRKGIVNMIRIQADKAVAMPTDTRLQILAVSKDIIHSWSIPAAGIKIDCIPGYSSHRVAVFTLSGIYWGQCMEICGRFHHWMPIVVYFMRRDLFCLWCIHFIFKNNQTNSTLQALDSSYFDSTSRVNYLNSNNWSYLA